MGAIPLVVRVLRKTRTQSIVDVFQVVAGARMDITDDVLEMGRWKRSRKGDGIVVWDHEVESFAGSLAFMLYGGRSPFDHRSAEAMFPCTIETKEG
jgi:hypothetical protein